MVDEVMLASTTKLSPEAFMAQCDDSWIFDLKWDGVRAVVSVDSSGVKITNRRGRDITFRYPDVVANWAGELWGTLDGEIICLTEEGRPDFAAVHKRDAQQSAGAASRAWRLNPALFMPFDILELGGSNVRDLPYTRRRQMLDDVTPGMISIASTDAEAMWAMVLDNDLEGLIAKRADSRYRPGRHKSWVKLKATKRLNVLVGGYTAGKGSKGSVGALEIYLWDPTAEALVSVGKVGSGLSAGDTREIMAGLERGDPVVVEVEYLEMSSNGHLRMPVFKGIRRDVAPEDCVTNTSE